VRCELGTYQDSAGASSCRRCAPGHWCTVSEQVPCGENKWNDEGGSHDQRACRLCPPFSSTVGVHDALSRDQCLCDVDHFDNSLATGAKAPNCQQCRVGTSCPERGTTLETLPLRPGYWRASVTSLDVRRCPDAAVNCASAICDNSSSGCYGGVDDITYCAPTLHGPLCRLCKNATDRVYYLAADSGSAAKCAACGSLVGRTIGIVVATAAGLLLALLVLRVLARKCPRRRTSLFATVERYRIAVKPETKLKILVSFYMLISKVDSVYEVTLPADVRRFLDNISIGISLGLSSTTSVLTCLGLRSYHEQLLLWMLLPPVLVGAIIIGSLTYLLSQRRLSRTTLMTTALPLIVRLLFLLYPLIANVAFEAFSCYPAFEDGRRYLIVDVSIECDWSIYAYRQARARAWSAIGVYAFGLLVLNAALLFSAREAILKRRVTPLSHAIHFLYREFEPWAFWWELCEMARRLALVGVFVMIEQGSMIQLILGTTFSAAYMLIQMQTGPYASMSDDFLANSCSFALLVFFLCCIVFKVGTLTELNAVRTVMADEQKRDFRNTTLELSLVLWASVASALFASFAILIVQLGIERERVQREARLAKARRLRYKADDTEAMVPLIMQGLPKHYHVFLSHVWATGQDQMRIVKQRLKEMLPDIEVFLDVDDLEEIGDLEGYIDRTSTILIYCSKGYFQSKNCMRELVSTAIKQKPTIALVDPDASRDGLSDQEVRAQLLEDQDGNFAKWGFDAETTPNAQALHDHLFQAEPIEWNRIGIFQDVTMRLLAERLLHDADGTTYVDGELIWQTHKPLPPPKRKHIFHVCCSEHNLGAFALMEELAEVQGFTLDLPDEGKGACGAFGEFSSAVASPARASADSPARRSSADRRPSSAGQEPSFMGFLQEAGQQLQGEVLVVTKSIDSLAECDHLLLYLTSQTWTRGEASEELADEVLRAMDLGVHVMLAHEMPGAGGQEARFSCEFGSFFSCVDGATPAALLKRGIYSEIAVALKGGPWREASMVMLGMAFELSKQEEEAQAAGEDVLGLGMERSDAAEGSLILRGVRYLRSRAKYSRTHLDTTVRSSTQRANQVEPKANATAMSSATVDTLDIEVEMVDGADDDVQQHHHAVARLRM